MQDSHAEGSATAKVPQSVRASAVSRATGVGVSPAGTDGPHRASLVRQYKMTRDEFLRETSGGERQALGAELSAALVYFVERDVPLYLDGIGVVIPRVYKENRAYLLEENHVVRNETVRGVDFEKCSELIAFNRERYPNIVETRELVQRIYPRLPLSMQIRWNEREAQRLLRGLFQVVRYDTIVKGHSRALLPIGELYALHNRQGSSLNDWFAGADIFLRPQYRQSLAVGPSTVTRRPVLENAWEILEAAYGPRVGTFTIDLHWELAALGYDVSTLKQYLPPDELHLNITAFKSTLGAKNDETVIVYCSDGLRNHDRSDGSGTGLRSELVFQLHLDSAHLSSAGTSLEQEIPLTRWPCRPMALAWLLLRNCKPATPRHGLRLSSDVPLFEGCDSSLSWIIITPFQSIRTEQVCHDGSFSFLNVVCVADDEARVADLYSAEHLITLLDYKRLAQHTKPTRSSVVARTGLMTDRRLQPAQKAPVPGTAVRGTASAKPQIGTAQA